MSSRIGKKELREAASARRRAMPARARERADRALAAAAAELVISALRHTESARVCAYTPMPTEPGGAHLISALAATGADLLLPVVLPDRDLDWASYRSGTESAPELLGREAIGSAAIVLVPALGVDSSGVRLGRGGGSYDRALARVPAATLVVALLYEGELHHELPVEPHDRLVTAALTPHGLRRCGQPRSM